VTRLEELAARAGIARHWQDIEGHWHQVGAATLRSLLAALQLRADADGAIDDSLAALADGERTLPPLLIVDSDALLAEYIGAGHRGRFRILAHDGTQVGEGDFADASGVRAPTQCGYYVLECDDALRTLAVAPPPRTTRERSYAVAAQLYSLRQSGDGGFGNYTALARTAEHAARRGAAAIALSPTHAISAREPGRASPYSPSSRMLYNILHVDPAQMFGAATLREILHELGAAEIWAQLEQAELIDWDGAGALRIGALRALYRRCRAAHPQRWNEFMHWRAQAGVAVELHACFEAIEATYACDDWRAWPRALRDPHSAAVSEFAQAHADEVGFHVFAQWLAAEGLARAQAQARAAGMAIGLIADLAVGVDPRGSDAWRQQGSLLEGVSIGAPPDLLAPQGQNWGLTTFAPTVLRASGYAAFLDLVRAALAHSGGLRIDHVIGLQRLWLVPRDEGAHAGGYVDYPRDDLLRLLALEAELRQCQLIGEDLGTVPPGFRDRLAQHSILGMSVLMFEHDERSGAHAYRPAREWRRDAAALTTTHDLPTLGGWWEGRDIEWRHRLGLIDEDGRAEQASERRLDRSALVARIEADGGPSIDDDDAARARERFIDAAIAQVARTPATLAIVPLEDLCGEVEQPNLPGTTSGHPNWRRRLPDDVDALFDRADVQRRLDVLAARRSDGEPA
jgi:4-alpha-glucanotransferase